MKINYSKVNVAEDPSTYTDSIHRLAETNPMMQQSEFEALKLSISTNGQLEPITVFRGKVIDGRNRLAAIKELGLPTILVNHLAHNTSSRVLNHIVEAKETRRMQTKTQLAIKAYRYMVDHKLPMTTVAKLFAVDRKDIRAARDLNKLNKIRIDILFDGGAVQLANGKHSKSIRTVLKDTKDIAYNELKNAKHDREVKDRSDKWKKECKDVYLKVMEKLTDEQQEYFTDCVRFNTWKDVDEEDSE